MPIEPLVIRDPDHRCPICGGETELISQTFTSWDGEKHQVEVTSRRRRCAVLDCKGHADGLNEPADAQHENRTLTSVQEETT
jgi:transposase